MASGGPGKNPSDVFQARLVTGGGVSNTLTLLPYAGNLVVANNLPIIVPPTGLTRLVGDNLIDAAGADSGAPGAANTLYYVYVSNGKALFSPSSIRLSATAPSLVNGVRYLGVAGNALNWRFVGWVRLNATPQFESNGINALIVNYYNRLSQVLQASPNYADTDAYQFTTVGPANWAAVAGATLDTVSLIANGEDEFLSFIFGMLQNELFISVGVDGAVEPVVCAGTVALAFALATVSAEKKITMAEGYHILQFIVANSGSSGNFYFDSPRKGAAKGPVLTGFNLVVPT